MLVMLDSLSIQIISDVVRHLLENPLQIISFESAKLIYLSTNNGSLVKYNSSSDEVTLIDTNKIKN